MQAERIDYALLAFYSEDLHGTIDIAGKVKVTFCLSWLGNQLFNTKKFIISWYSISKIEIGENVYNFYYLGSKCKGVLDSQCSKLFL